MTRIGGGLCREGYNKRETTVFTVKPAQDFTSIKRPPFSCPVIENFIE
jgi:hypothetical protein